MAFQDKDLAEKLLLVNNSKNRAKQFSELSDAVASDLVLVSNRGWSSMSDEELAEIGITKYGRGAVDGIRNV